MKYIILPLTLLLIVFAIVGAIPVQAESQTQLPQVPSRPETPFQSHMESGNLPEIPSAPEIPEKPGDYPDPENPNLRVKVFVYEPEEAVTGAQMACTDPDSSAVVEITGWKLPQSMAYSLNPNSVPSSINPNSLATISKSSFSAWQTAIGGKVSFVRGSDTTTTKSRNDRRNIIAWGNVSNNQALAVTYTRYNSATGQVVDVDTIFSRRFAWKWTDPSVSACSLYTSAYDVQNILTHELGHWMGLKDEYTASYTNNTMYGYGSVGETKKDTLTSGDISGATLIYP